MSEPVGLYRHVVLAFISSQIPPDLLETDLVLDEHHPDFVLTGLKVSSMLRLYRLMMVTTSIVQRELGELSSDMQAEVKKRLRKLFGL